MTLEQFLHRLAEVRREGIVKFQLDPEPYYSPIYNKVTGAKVPRYHIHPYLDGQQLKSVINAVADGPLRYDMVDIAARSIGLGRSDFYLIYRAGDEDPGHDRNVREALLAAVGLVSIPYSRRPVLGRLDL